VHELSIAVSLVDRACEESERRGGRRIEAIFLRLGPYSGVVEDALRFSWDLATAGGAAEGARLEIEHVPLVVHCPRCDADREPPGVHDLRCPVCGSPAGEVVSGGELELRALAIGEPMEEAGEKIGAPLKPLHGEAR
jgi:hydrogenase nickel incorporation protein HypA/HybF